MKNTLWENLTWLPNAEQSLLLQAALGDSETARRAWLEWRENYSLETLEYGSRRLLPLVYQNLRELGVEDALLPRLKQAHRETFRDNQLLFREIEQTIKILETACVRTLLLKGAALSSRYYASTALRPMSDVDLMIERANVLEAVEILEKNGWRIAQKNLPLIMQTDHSCQFNNTDGRELDLHWNLLTDCWNAHKNQIFWDSAVELQFGGAKTLALSATDQLFHVCCHGARGNQTAPIRWITDATMILRAAAEIDWQRIIDLAHERRFNLALFLSLKYLKDNFAAPVPQDFLQKIATAPVSDLERVVFRLSSEEFDKPWTFGRYAQELRFKFSSLRSSTTLKPRSLVFVKYLQYAFDLESAWQVPPHLFYQAFRRFILRKPKLKTSVLTETKQV